MNRLDERLKEQARREDCPIPQGFDGRMDAILGGLPEGRGKPDPRRLRRWAVAGVLAAVLCMGGVAVASDALESIAWPDGFGGAAEGPQPYSVEMGASITDQDYTLTLDGIGVDETFATLYAIITGEEPIPRNNRGEPELWSFSLKAERKELEFWDQNREAGWVDDYTLKVTRCCPVARALPDMVELQVYTSGLFYGLSGDWNLNLLADETASDGESLVVKPGQRITLDGRWWTTSRAVVAPSGGGLVLAGAGGYPPGNFFTRDNQGNYLYKKYCDMVSRPSLPISSFVAFYGGRPDMESITLMPYGRVYPGDGPGGNHKIFGAMDELPLTDGSAETGYTLISLDIGAEQAVARLQTGKELLQYEYGGLSTEVGLLDKGRGELELGDTYLDRSYDWETGVWAVTLSYSDAGPAELARAEQLWVWQPSDTIRVPGDEAVIIPLS